MWLGEPTVSLRAVRLIVTLALSILAAPVAADAQWAAKAWRFGLSAWASITPLPSCTASGGPERVGHEEGKNLRLDWRNLTDEEAARATAEAFGRDRV